MSSANHCFCSDTLGLANWDLILICFGPAPPSIVGTALTAKQGNENVETSRGVEEAVERMAAREVMVGTKHGGRYELGNAT